MYRVLIADDEERIRNGIAKLIEQFDIDLQVCALVKNGAEALESTRIHLPEIVLIDINMPQLNGLEAIERIQAIHPEAVIIIISGYDRFDYAQKAVSLGVYHYLLKPFQNDEFRDLLLSALETYREKAQKKNLITHALDTHQTNQKAHILAYIKDRYRDPQLSMSLLESTFSMGKTSIANYIKRETGKTFIDYVTQLKIEHAKDLLGNPDITILQISKLLGFSSQHYFSRVFKNQTGFSPLQFRCQK
ncbi:response regulator [Gottschalkiaceae bacterium SANA]|nr:response regulator [Gottschalkiaceae bacterium SANA]